jgi:dTDP-4-dehydrorhamnose reductase
VVTTHSLLVTGAGGQVGREVVAAAKARGWGVRGLGRQDLDVTSADDVAHAVSGATFVVNAAAYTAVDRAESERDAATAVNALAARTLALACRGAGVPLLHYSTDYVFDGSGTRPWREDDPILPLGHYGATKAQGEANVRAALKRHLIVRTSWVFASHGANFVRTMTRLLCEHPEVRVVDDQVGGPTAARDIAAASIAMIEQSSASGFANWGTYHYAGAPDVSWWSFAEAIRAWLAAGQASTRPLATIVPIASSQHPTATVRPSNSRLDCSKVFSAFGVSRPEWRDALKQVIAELQLPSPAR